VENKKLLNGEELTLADLGAMDSKEACNKAKAETQPSLIAVFDEDTYVMVGDSLERQVSVLKRGGPEYSFENFRKLLDASNGLKTLIELVPEASKEFVLEDGRSINWNVYEVTVPKRGDRAYMIKLGSYVFWVNELPENYSLGDASLEVIADVLSDSKQVGIPDVELANFLRQEAGLYDVSEVQEDLRASLSDGGLRLIVKDGKEL